MIDSPRKFNTLSSAENDGKLNFRELAVEIISIAGANDVTDNICLYQRDNEVVVVAHPHGVCGFLNEGGPERPFYSVPASRCYCDDEEVSEEDGYGKPLTGDFAEYDETVEAIAKEIEDTHDKVLWKPEPGSFEEIEVSLRDKLGELIEDALTCKKGGRLQSRRVYRKGAELAVVEVEASHHGTTGWEEQGYSFVVAVDDMTVDKDEVEGFLDPSGSLMDEFLDLARENVLEKERDEILKAYEEATRTICIMPDYSKYSVVISTQPDFYGDFTLKDGETAQEYGKKCAEALTRIVNFAFPGIITEIGLRYGVFGEDEAICDEIGRWIQDNLQRVHK